MAEKPDVLDVLGRPNNNAPDPGESEDVVQWPLSYRLTLPAEEQAQAQPVQRSQTQWWHHNRYQNSQDQKPTVLYSRTKARSEEIAQLFLNESVLGFDMEWPWPSESTRLQEKVGLIQIASESHIGLFHIGLHGGETMEDILAPSLQKIIESPDIIKTGVAILNADFSRLQKYFDLNPKAAFELSHLHRLVTYGQAQPDQLTTRLVKLATQWSRPLLQSQIDYAANDAYCAFMLYHCMDAKRSAMDPKPPMPLLADEYADRDLALPRSLIKSLMLQPSEKGDAPIHARTFFKKPSNDKEKQTSDTGDQDPTKPPQETCELENKPRHRKGEPRTAKVNEPTDAIPLDDGEKELFEMLRQRRREIAATQGVSAFVVAYNTVLNNLARQQPLNKDELLLIKGIGPAKAEKYGEDWINVITQFNAERKAKPLQPSQPKTQTSTSCPERRAGTTSPQQQALPTIPQAHTGLSFSVKEITLDPAAVSENPCSPDSGSGSDSSSAFGSPLLTPTRPHNLPPILKRKRTPTPQRSPTLPPTSPHPPPLSQRHQIFHNKLLAFSKLVTAKLDPRPSNPIISDATLRLLVRQPPRSKRELWEVPDIVPFLKACAVAKCNLLGNIDKWRIEAESGV